MRPERQVLLIYDGQGDDLVSGSLQAVERAGYTVTRISPNEAIGFLETAEPDVVVVALPPELLVDCLNTLNTMHPGIPTVVLSGSYQGVARGPEEYLARTDLTGDSIARSIKHASQRYRYQAAERALRAVRGELGSARQVQAELFPPPPPDIDLWGEVSSVGVSGDFYDFLQLPGGQLVIAVGDVTGHGLDAALLMATARAYLRAIVHLVGCANVGDVMGKLNGLLCGDVGDERFVAMSLARLDIGSMTLHYCAAGQPPGYLLTADGIIQELGGMPALPLGIERGTGYESIEFPLAAQDMLVFLTDGVLEANSPAGEYFGTGNLLAALQRHRGLSAREVVGSLQADLTTYAAGVAHRDDLTLVVVKLP